MENKSKTEHIIRIQEFYNIEIQKVDLSRSYTQIFNYSINEKGVIVGLNLPKCNISDLSILNDLRDLEYLNLTNNEVTDISSLFPQKNLKVLYVGGNRITDISFLKHCTKLKILAIWENPIINFSPIASLIKLEALYCQKSNIPDLKFLKSVRSLKTLAADDNNINDLSPLVNLKLLSQVSLGRNNISDLDSLKNHRVNLAISLHNNLFNKISIEIANKFNFKIINSEFFPRQNINREGLFIGNNQLKFPPNSVIELGEETIKTYYDAVKLYSHAPLSEGRIIFIGDGSAGKSSLVEKILHGTFRIGKQQTNGIKIDNLILEHPEDNRKLVFHLWDFGGQEIQHAVHKFFFTEGCLYILVLDNRKEEEPEYWLQQIESLGGGASVLVVFNKHDENPLETADKKYLKEKYPNIIGFYNVSCKTGYGINDMIISLKKEVVELPTVGEQFPINWLSIKKAIEEYTSGENHYLTYDSYKDICDTNQTEDENVQKLLLKYLNTIGSVTWFGEDTHLKFLHVLNPAWITQGVYKILTSKKTATQQGKIHVSDFKQLLCPLNESDFFYEEQHYGYLLSMMKKFDLCDAPDDNNLLIPSAFNKIPKVEYSEFRGEDVRIYILQFKDYMPLALIHRFTAKKISEALDDNYWYSGIVIKDSKSKSLAMVHADKEAKRIYVRIKGEASLGMWEYIRRDLESITMSYAKIAYNELVVLEDNLEINVNYVDLVGYLQAGKSSYFHPKLGRDFNVGYLMGLFENKETTIEKIKSGHLTLNEHTSNEKISLNTINILNNNSPSFNNNILNQIEINIDLNFVNTLSNEIEGDVRYLLEELDVLKLENKELTKAFEKILLFVNDAKSSNNKSDIKAKSWGRKLKPILEFLSKSGEQIKNISDGSEVLNSIFKNIQNLAAEFDLNQASEFIKNLVK